MGQNQTGSITRKVKSKLCCQNTQKMFTWRFSRSRICIPFLVPSHFGTSNSDGKFVHHKDQKLSNRRNIYFCVTTTISFITAFIFCLYNNRQVSLLWLWIRTIHYLFPCKKSAGERHLTLTSLFNVWESGSAHHRNRCWDNFLIKGMHILTGPLGLILLHLKGNNIW